MRPGRPGHHHADLCLGKRGQSAGVQLVHLSSCACKRLELIIQPRNQPNFRVTLIVLHFTRIESVLVPTCDLSHYVDRM